MKQISTTDIDQLAAKAAAAPRQRANLNLHPELADPIQRLAIAMEPGTYVRPHRHPHTWELLYPLRGRFVVLHFNAAGQVIDRAVLGEGTAALETAAGTWHAVLSLDVGGVIFEVKHGPYSAIDPADYLPGTPAEGEPGMADLIHWYADAQPGMQLPG